VSKARLVITAVVVEGRSPSEVARTYGVARSWVYALVTRYRTEGDTAFEPRSRRPQARPRQTPVATVELVVNLRRSLTRQGLDAGPVTIAWHLQHHHQITLSRATIYRILRNAELVTPEPKKKPRSSYVRFQAEQPNETWQSDVTHWRLANGVEVEILTWLDDHSRYALSVTAHLRVTGRTVVDTFRAATEIHGIPFSTLTDNGLVFTTRFAQGGRTSRNGFETELWSAYNHSTAQKVIQFLQQQLAQVGIKAKILALEAGQRVEKVESWPDAATAPVRLLYIGWSSSTGEADWALRPLLASESVPPRLYNTAYYKSPKVDAAIKGAQLTTDSAEKAKLYKEAQDEIWKDAPWAFLVTERLLSVNNKKLSGVYVMPDASFAFEEADLK